MTNTEDRLQREVDALYIILAAAIEKAEEPLTLPRNALETAGKSLKFSGDEDTVTIDVVKQ